MRRFNLFSRLAMVFAVVVALSNAQTAQAQINPDINGDGVIDKLDVDEICSQVIAGLCAPPWQELPLSGDYNLDGCITNDYSSPWLEFGGGDVGFQLFYYGLLEGKTFKPGDANLDGVVDVSDFNIWNANKFSCGKTWSDADFNCDGCVDISDLNIWNNNKF